MSDTAHRLHGRKATYAQTESSRSHARPILPGMIDALPDNVRFINHHPTQADHSEELLAGLLAENKSISPKFFYDTYGSELFEAITELPEYYPTRTERDILQHHADEIAQCCGTQCVLIEPGSGSSEKVRLLLNALQPAAYVPMDIAAEFLCRASIKLAQEFPWLAVHAMAADFASCDSMPPDLPGGKRVMFYPGSTLGNMSTDAAREFLLAMRAWLGEDGGVLIGIDLHKDTDTLHAAYNDSQGVTAEFNLNVLRHVNSLLDADFDTDNFAHHAFYNEQHCRIEMHLRCQRDHQVRLGERRIAFAAGETIHTENSYKYTIDGFRQLAHSAGYVSEAIWLDPDRLFSVHYLAVA